jgi:hypothetical protein
MRAIDREVSPSLKHSFEEVSAFMFSVIQALLGVENKVLEGI